LIDRAWPEEKQGKQAKADNYKQKKGLFAARNGESGMLARPEPVVF
jgi:hypothetical protein